MRKRTPSRRNPIGHARRRSSARRRVGIDARCGCGESRPEALIAGTRPIVCEQCMRRRKGKTAIDRHHVAGRANDPTTIPLPANDHVAVLSEDQRDWPEPTLTNPDGDPLLRCAACLRGFWDTVRYLAERLLLTAACALEMASRFLTDTLGRFWWRKTPLAAFAPIR